MFNIVPGMTGLGYVKDIFTRCWDISNSTLGRWETGQYDQIEDDIEESTNKNLTNAKGEFGTLKAPKDYKEPQFTQNGTSNSNGPDKNNTTSFQSGEDKSAAVVKGSSKSTPTASYKTSKGSISPTGPKENPKPTPTRSSHGDEGHSARNTMTFLLSASSESQLPVEMHIIQGYTHGVHSFWTEYKTASSTASSFPSTPVS